MPRVLTGPGRPPALQHRVRSRRSGASARRRCAPSTACHGTPWRVAPCASLARSARRRRSNLTAAAGGGRGRQRTGGDGDGGLFPPSSSSSKSGGGGGPDDFGGLGADDFDAGLLEQLALQAVGPRGRQQRPAKAPAAAAALAPQQQQEQAEEEQQQQQQSGEQEETDGADGDAASAADARQRFLRLAQVAERVLEGYDIRTDVPRAPNVTARWRLEQGPAGLSVGMSLTAEAIAQERMGRRPRQEAPSEPPAVLIEVPARPEGSSPASPVPGAPPVTPPPPMLDDERWRRKLKGHRSFADYMRELRAVEAAPGERTRQLVYQIGIAEDWLQLALLLDTFGDEVGAIATAALFKRLAVICTAKALALQSPSERRQYAEFLSALCTHARSVAGGCRVAQASSILYGMAALEVSDTQLCSALVDASASELARGAAGARAAAAAPRGSGVGSSAAALDAAFERPSAALTASEAASLLWGLGTLGHRPDSHWLDDLADCCRPLLTELQPSQLWGVLWGFARLRHLPDAPWMDLWLARAREALRDCPSEALGHMAWALGALQYVPDRLWLRALAGTASFKARSFLGPQLTQLLTGLAALGYCPRPPVCLALGSQLRRQLHALRPPQLAAALHAIGSYGGRWRPGRRFMFDFVTHSQAKVDAWTGPEAVNVLWSFASLGYCPESPYRTALLARIASQLPACPPDSLCQALWAAAKLPGCPVPAEWVSTWLTAAEPHIPELSPPALTAAAAGLAAARASPGAGFMTALTRRASEVLGGCSCAELTTLIGGLADLRWRPSDAWLKAFTRQVESQLPAFENEDWGVLLYGLASMGQPLAPAFLLHLSTTVKRRFYSLSGEGLGLLVWGLAQYGGPLPLVLGADWEEDEEEEEQAEDANGIDESAARRRAAAAAARRARRPVQMPPQQVDAEGRRRREKLEAWWEAFYAEGTLKWASLEARGGALLLVGLGQLHEAGALPLPPGEWQSGALTALRRVFGKQPDWQALVSAVREAAGMDPDERLPGESPWFVSMLTELGRRCGAGEPPPQGLGALLDGPAGPAAGVAFEDGAAELREAASAAEQMLKL